LEWIELNILRIIQKKLWQIFLKFDAGKKLNKNFWKIFLTFPAGIQKKTPPN